MTRFSMITAVFNGAKTISDTFDSIRAQSSRDIQYIVIDALSSDETPDIVACYEDIVTDYVREKDKGLYDAMNKGIALARGEFIGIINADDKLMPGVIPKITKIFDESNADYVFSDLLLMNEAGSVTGLLKAQKQWIDGKKNVLGRDWRMNIGLPHPALFVRKSVYDELGVYDLQFKLSADHDFVARLISHQKRGVYVSEPLAAFREGGISEIKRIDCFYEDERIACKYGLHPILARLIRVRKTHYARRLAAKAAL